MRLRTELAATMLGFVVLDLLLVFAAIGLFVRMGPAIERILERNDATIVAAEQVLHVMAQAGGAAVAASDRARTTRAVEQARANVTEPGEQPIVDAVDRLLPLALDGDVDARGELVDRLVDLIEINRAAMHAVDEDAQRLGQAGAWIAALAGFLTLALSMVLMRRVQRRLLVPLRELRDALHTARAGDVFRRCTMAGAAPELQETMAAVNDLLDARQAATPLASAPVD